MEPLELAFAVDCSVEHAFDVWAQRTSMWWPSGHPVSAQPGLSVAFEPAEEGTAVRIVHRGWERLGAAADERRERNKRGWGGVLEHYRVAA
jgi:hypothetical protein